MKRLLYLMVMLLPLLTQAQLKVGNNPTTINSSAVLDVESTTKGFLPPRMTTAQRTAIVSPAAGLTIFNTDTKALEVNTGTPGSPVWSSAKSGDVANTTLTSSSTPAGTSQGQMMYNTGSVQPTGLVYWDGSQWKSVASSGGNTTNNYTVVNNKTVTNNDSVINNNPVVNNDSLINNGQVFNNSTVTNAGPVINNNTSTFNGTSTFNNTSTFNKKAVFNDTAVFTGGMKVSNLPAGLPTDSILVFEPTTKVMRRISVTNAAAAGEPWYKVGTTSGATSNTDNVFINGRVGVGTSAPDAKLHISGDASTSFKNSIIYSTNTGTDGHSWSFGARPRGTAGDFAISDETDGATRMTIQGGTGNVGIGTTSPDAKLHISGDATSNFKNSTIYSTNTGTDGHSWSFGARPRGTAGDFAISDETDAATRMTLQGGTGNVGIGTSSPLEKLDVAGNLALRNSSVAGGNKHIAIKNSTGLDRWAMGMGVAETGSGNTGGNFYLWNYADDGSLLGNPFVINRATGNVGVGTGSPAQKLDVTGNLALRNSSVNGGNKHISIQNSAGLDRWAMGMAVAESGSGNAGGNFYLWNYDDNGNFLGNPFIIERSTGNVGIGTSPAYRLDVRDDVDGLARFRFQNSSAGANNRSDIAIISNGNGLYMGVDNGSTIYGSGSKSYMDNRSGGRFVFGTNSVEQMTVTTDGRVGIGTSSPKAPLHIGGTTSASFSTGVYTYFDATFANAQGVTRSTAMSGRTDASLITEGNIWSKAAIHAVASLTYSDRRIKNIIGQSNAGKDLDLLNKIRITDYRMKDVVMQGNKQYKKVIAQDVEAIYPEAVTQQTGFVPNIYQLADKVQSMGNNTYKASFKNKVEYNKNVTGDIKLYDEQKEITAKLVSKGDNEIVFTTTDAINGDKLFLFGEEVTDFRAVDYEALSTLNISATQELYREIQALKKQNTELMAHLTEMKKLESAYIQLAAQVKEMQQVLSLTGKQSSSVAVVKNRE